MPLGHAKNRPMRRLLTSLLMLAPLACADDKGDDTSTSSTGAASCSASVADGPDVDPDFPPCDCSPDYCKDGASCRFTGLEQPNWTSSICLPSCTVNADCPTLNGVPTECNGEVCWLPCNDQKDPPMECPTGYVCSPSLFCEAQLL